MNNCIERINELEKKVAALEMVLQEQPKVTEKLVAYIELDSEDLAKRIVESLTNEERC
ncbi:MAG: hypothetical protein WBI17_07135 [Clostridiaceae bacterium]